MNSRDRKLLRAALGDDLPPGFRLTEWDDFINYALEGRSCRAIRIVGPRRILVLFHHFDDPFGHPGGRREYRLLYLDEYNELREFFPKAIEDEYNRKATPLSKPFHWEREIGDWLEAHGARTFKGRGWAADCAMKVCNLVTRWSKHYSGRAA
jgi:hypothetical protein